MKKTLALLLVVVMIVVSISACGNGEGKSKEQANSSTDLKISYWNAGYGSEWLEGFVDAFKKEYPQYNVILNMSASNTSIMTAYGQEDVDDTDLYLNVTRTDTEYLEPLNDILETTIDGEGKTIGEKFDVEFKEMAVSQDGNYYNMPYMGYSVGGIVYNKKMFDQYGISVPRTTSELAVVADTLLAEGIPAFCHFQGAGYWDYAEAVWFAQYEGYDYFYNNFFACTDEKGESPSIEVLRKKDGRYEILKVMESILTPEYVLEGSNSKTHVIIQTEFLNEKAAMMVNGAWIESEMSSVDNMDDYGVMRIPVISAITDKLTTVKTEAALRKVIVAIDSVINGGKTAEDYKSGENYVIGDLTVSAADWEYVYEARCMAPGGYLGNTAYIPKYSTAKEAAKDFLKFMYSDKGAKLMGELTQMKMPLTLCEGEIDSSGWSKLKKEFLDLTEKSIGISGSSVKTHPIFTQGGATMFAGVGYIPHLCTQNSSDRWSADVIWNQVVQKVNDNYKVNWLANIK